MLVFPITRNSSYGVYLGNDKDNYGILNTDFILSQFGNSPETAQIQYAQFVTRFITSLKKKNNS